MSSRIFKLYVQSDETCLELLRYIDRHIFDVNSMGVGVHVIKVDDTDGDELALLGARGITRLPTLIAPDGKTTFVGAKKIRGIFEQNLGGGGGANHARGGISDDPDQYESALDALYASEMYAGRDKKGKPIPRKDKDESSEDVDYSRKMAEYRKREPKHRRGGSERDPSPRRRRRDESSEDNVDEESSEDEPAPRRGGRGGRGGGNGDPIGEDLHARMLDEMMRGD